MNSKAVVGTFAAVCLAVGVAPRLHAQAMSTFNHAKRAASNAVAATNEHTNREQMVGSSAAAPEKSAKNGASAPAHSSSAVPAAARARV